MSYSTFGYESSIESIKNKYVNMCVYMYTYIQRERKRDLYRNRYRAIVY